MTINIADNSPRISYSVGDGVTQTSFTVPFEFFDDEDLNVYVDGTLKTLTSDYTVSGGDGSTGTITMSVTGASGGSTVVITRDITLERTTDFPVSGAFNIVALNTELDRLIAVAADLDDRASRALQLTDYDVSVGLTLPVVDTRKGKTLAFNATTGAVEAGPSIADTQSVADASADIALLADIQDGTIATNALTNLNSIRTDVTTVSGISANVTTVAANNANVTTVATNDANITTVAGSIANVNTVGNSITNVNTTASNIASVNTVAGEIGVTGVVTIVANAITDVSTVSSDIAAVITAANDLNEAVSEIDTVANAITNVDLVGTNIANVNTVAGISADVTTVAADGTDIGIVAGISSNVTTVAGISANVTTVAGVSSGVTTVAGISADVSTVSGISSNVTTVANNSANVTTVAGISSDVTTVAGISSNVTTVATNLTSINSFANTYRIGTTDPTTSLDTGDLFFNTSSGVLKVYNGTAWEAGVTAGSGFLPLTGGTLTGGLTGTTATFTGDLTIDTNTLYVDSTNNRVGIGTTSIGANQALQVRVAADQNIAFNAATGNPRITAFNDAVSSSLDLNFNGASLRFETGGTERMRIDSSGNVGIGATSPTSQLNIRGSSTTAALDIQGTDSTIQGRLYADNAGQTILYADRLGNAVSPALRFYIGATERMRIDSSGNLLVGKTTGAFSTEGIVAYSSTDSNGSRINITTDGGVPLSLNRLTSDGEIAGFYKDGTTVGSIGSSNGDLLVGNSDVGLKFHDANNTIYPWNVSTDVASDGLLDIGGSTIRFKDLYLSGGVVETTTTVSYAASIALTYDNGSIQTVTLTGNVEFTDSLADGEAIVLMLNAGASYTVTWTAVTKWVSSSGNAAPTLTANDTIVLWKIGTTVYAAYAGSYT